MGCKVLQGVTGGYKGYRGLEGVRGGYMGLQGLQMVIKNIAGG